jgi:hypothetical protein
MTMSQFEPLEKLWGDLLSREPSLVIRAFEKLDPDIRQNVIKHLNAMVSEKGWHIEQKKSARIALKTIHSMFPEAPKS